MIKFSWKKINDKFDWNATSVLEYFYLKHGMEVPAYLGRKVPEKVKKAARLPYESGPCFIINSEAVLREAKSPNDLYLYLELASKRNVFDYMIRGVKHLPLALVPKYLVEWVEISPIMKIETDNVYFKYEQEITQYGY